MLNSMMDVTKNQESIVNRKIEPMWYQDFVNYIDVKPNSIETYKRSLTQFVKYLMENDILQPTRADIMNYRDSLLERLKASTVQVYIISVRQFFKWTAQEGLYPNIAENIKGVRIGKEHKRDALTKQQLRRILSGIDRSTLIGKRDYSMILTMLIGGLRTITIKQANIEDLRTRGENTVLYIQGKGRDEKSEYIKIPEQVENTIREYLNARESNEPEMPLFAGIGNRSRNKRLTTKSISRLVKETFRKAGYDDSRLSAHSIRHTTATVNLMNGGTLEETKQLLRHSNINTTMIYAHHLDREKNESEQRIADALLE